MQRAYGKTIVCGLTAIFILLAATVQASSSYGRMIVFGDSLSDPGNVYAINGELAQAPFALIPQAPYAIGGLHFTNGTTWIEQLATDFGVANTVGPAFSGPLPFSNYAVGGSTARYMANSGADMDLATQVGIFLYQTGGVPEDALVVIMIGGNDIFDALESANPMLVLNQAVDAIEDQVRLLNAMGSHKLLISNVPNIGKTPAALYAGPLASFYAETFSQIFNGMLFVRLSEIVGDTGMDIRLMDSYGAMMAVINAPDAYGFSNVSQPCITPAVKGNALCGNAREYLFWDGIHPTTKGHGVLRQAAHDASPVPAAPPAT